MSLSLKRFAGARNARFHYQQLYLSSDIQLLFKTSLICLLIYRMLNTNVSYYDNRWPNH